MPDVVTVHAVAVHAATVHALLLHSARTSREVCDNIEGDGLRDCTAKPEPLRRVMFGRALRLLLSVLLPRLPSIDVITPTWLRRGLLTGRCMPSVAAQDYDGPVRHIIVSDGPDPELAGLPVIFLPEHLPEPNRGLSARKAGAALGSAPAVAYLDDDNAWRPDHLAVLAAALAESGADFAYSRARVHNGNGRGLTIGAAPPVFAQIDTSLLLHRRELLAVAGWQPSARPADWDLVDRWLTAGASYVHVPRITLDYWTR